MYVSLLMGIVFAGMWMVSMLHMYHSGRKDGFKMGNVVGVSNTLKLMETTGVLTEETYEKVFKHINKGK